MLVFTCVVLPLALKLMKNRLAIKRFMFGSFMIDTVSRELPCICLCVSNSWF